MITMRVEGASPSETPMARFSWPRASKIWADSVGPAITTALKAKAPVAPVGGGGFKRSLKWQLEASTGVMTLKFGSSLSYAPYVVNPTKAHTIVPVNAKALRFLNYGHAPGALVFTKRVEHPGTRGNDFPKLVIEPMGPVISEALKAAVAAAQGG